MFYSLFVHLPLLFLSPLLRTIILPCSTHFFFLEHPSITFMVFLSSSHFLHQIRSFSSPTGPPFSPYVQTTSTHTTLLYHLTHNTRSSSYLISHLVHPHYAPHSPQTPLLGCTNHLIFTIEYIFSIVFNL